MRGRGRCCIWIWGRPYKSGVRKDFGERGSKTYETFGWRPRKME